MNEKKNPTCVANLCCECQELKPKVETNTSFLVVHPSGVDTVETVGSHLKLNLIVLGFDWSIRMSASFLSGQNDYPTS